jgi:hypothetical protein
MDIVRYAKAHQWDAERLARVLGASREHARDLLGVVPRTGHSK